MQATVFIPEGKESIFLKKFEAYCFKDDPRSGMPKNKKLAESINGIRLPTIKSFWTDNLDVRAHADVCTFEVWIRRSKNGHKADVADVRHQSFTGSN
jgi:hypothetical protein